MLLDLVGCQEAMEAIGILIINLQWSLIYTGAMVCTFGGNNIHQNSADAVCSNCNELNNIISPFSLNSLEAVECEYLFC